MKGDRQKGYKQITFRWWHRFNGSSQLDVLFEEGRGWSLRFGRPTWRSFTERYQGTRGIPERYRYALGGRLTLIRHRKEWKR